MTTENHKINSPLLYRLIDDSPDLQREKKNHAQIHLNEFYEQIRRNLENLLNTRLNYVVWSDDYDELKSSILNYGVSDFTLNYFGHKNAQIKLCQTIKETIGRFEPRIQKVNVVPIENDSDLERILKLRIECEVLLKPTSVPAVFVSSLDVSSHKFCLE